jgi:hypothetical protein
MAAPVRLLVDWGFFLNLTSFISAVIATIIHSGAYNS